jgi:hypothetical protein
MGDGRMKVAMEPLGDQVVELRPGKKEPRSWQIVLAGNGK